MELWVPDQLNGSVKGGSGKAILAPKYNEALRVRIARRLRLVIDPYRKFIEGWGKGACKKMIAFR